jgi:cysteine desulfurase
MSTYRYFDYAASAPLDARAKAAMDAAAAIAGNPSSLHEPGRLLRSVVDRARQDVGRLLGVDAGDVTFTSGATEANDAAVLGVLRAVRRAHPSRALRVITTPFEHASVAAAIAVAERDLGVTVDLLPVGRDGRVTAADVASRLGEDVVLVAVMWVNNVLGTVQPIVEIGQAVAAVRAARHADGLPLVFLSDAVQAMATIDVRPAAAGVDLLTISSHKLGGPKGMGALVMRKGVPFEPLIVGGGQEGGKRHGTENVPAIAGFGAIAASLAVERAQEAARLTALRKTFVDGLSTSVPNAEIVCDDGVPNVAFLRFHGMSGDEVAMRMDAAGFAVSAGSACDSGKRKPPRALVAVLGEQNALRGGMRVSFGRETTEADVFALVSALATP